MNEYKPVTRLACLFPHVLMMMMMMMMSTQSFQALFLGLFIKVDEHGQVGKKFSVVCPLG